jgi:hypothetical protein
MANLERTFIAIKPDGVQRGLVGEIIKRFEQKGFRLVAMKFLRVRRPWSPAPSSPVTRGTHACLSTSPEFCWPVSFPRESLRPPLLPGLLWPAGLFPREAREDSRPWEG